MMHREVTAIVLCVLAQAASAQCVAAPPAANTQVVASAGTVTHNGATTATQPSTRAELIKTAAASTRDELPPGMHEARAHAPQPQDRPRRGGTAMLLAALALMSGIALRRYAANNP